MMGVAHDQHVGCGVIQMKALDASEVGSEGE
jgi:hypothetical protein